MADGVVVMQAAALAVVMVAEADNPEVAVANA
jgi:hypothetical protein